MLLRKRGPCEVSLASPSYDIQLQMTAYSTKHQRVYRVKGKASLYLCGICEESLAQEWSQIHGTTGNNPKDYWPLCCSCHQQYDNHWDESARKKVADTSKQRWQDPSYKSKVGKKISEARMGHEVTEETKMKISAGKKGVPNPSAGQKRTPEQCERIRIARWGR